MDNLNQETSWVKGTTELLFTDLPKLATLNSP